jgi:hypothetical protein
MAEALDDLREFIAYRVREGFEEAEKHQRAEGYVFFHLQCTERAIKTGQLLMAYGCIEDDPEAFQRVGNKIVAEFGRKRMRAEKWR